MKLLAHVLCLSLSLAASWAEEKDVVYLRDGDQAGHHDPLHSPVPDRCQGLEMDAVTVDLDGIPYFFKDEFLFKGLHGPAEPISRTFPELRDPNNPGRIRDVVYILDQTNPQQNGHNVIFLEDKVYKYLNKKLEDGYPKPTAEDFPGIPVNLDAAVECPRADCGEDSVIFFKEKEAYYFQLTTKTVHKKAFDSMPNCTSAFRFMEHYYCFHGHSFSKFDPQTLFVQEKYPKDVRGYFVRSPTYGDHSDPVDREQCSRLHLDAITGDGEGNLIAFRGHSFLYKDKNATLSAGLIESEFRELHSDVDAVYTYKEHLYMMKDKDVFLYRMGKPHVLVDGYPKLLKDEMGIDGPVDAAFICDDDVAHVIKGPSIISVDMKMTPHTPVIEHPIFSFPKVGAVMCHGGEVKLFVGNHYYNFKSPMDFVAATVAPEPHKVSMDLFGCDH